MKKPILFLMTACLIAILAISIKSTTGQESTLFVMKINDEAILSVTGANGTIQWQESIDSISWTNIVGATALTYTSTTTSSATGRRYFRAEITNSTSCENSPVWYSNIIRHRIINSTTELQIGDWFHGGIVFYSAGDGTGLTAASENQCSYEWGCDQTYTGATSDTDGYANTQTINSACSESNAAGNICNDLSLNGHNDWFLPAKNQLYSMYQYRIILGMGGGSYWSSTEYSSTAAWRHRFSDNLQSYLLKYNSMCVRCARSLSDVNETTYCTAEVTVEPIAASVSAQPEPQNICLGGSVTFSVSASGSQPFNYQWKKDGVDITNATDSTYTISSVTFADEAVYTCEVSNMCNSITSNGAELTEFTIPSPVITSSDLPEICPGDSIIFTADSGYIEYLWNTSDTTLSITAFDAGAYSVTVTDTLGCIGTSDDYPLVVYEPFENEQVCLVTVDPTVGKNMIIWEKSPGVRSAYFYIYKEVTVTIWNWLGSVLFDDETTFIDYSSTPESHGDKYKISVVDSCGNESAMSFYHKTMNLGLSNVGTTMYLDWDEYEDESGTFIPDQYYIYRGTTLSDMNLLDSISASFTSWNDLNVFDIYYYMIGVSRADPCDIGGTKTLYTSAFSNKKDNEDIIIGLREQIGYSPVNIYPNPFNDKTTIEFDNPDNSSYTLTMTDITGKIVKEIKEIHDDKIEIDRDGLESGLYTIELKGEKLFTGKIIIE